jgi:hypothetical protein
MLSQFKKLVGKISYRQDHPKLEGERGIRDLGHRKYVGGMWDEIGRLQFDFLVQQGLRPSHCLLDIACGSLRGGVHFIDYLQVGNYLGIDKERRLIELGIEQEIGRAKYDEKKPEFVVSDRFEFEKFSRKPQFSIAQSLFTHLNKRDIHLCLKNLRQSVEQDHVFFATFFEAASLNNPETSHSHAAFRYSRDAMEEIGEQAGWKATYIGCWQHPRNQMMMKYEVM